MEFKCKPDIKVIWYKMQYTSGVPTLYRFGYRWVICVFVCVCVCVFVHGRDDLTRNRV